MYKKITKAVIPIAGLGMRMRPWTKYIPKTLLPVNNKPVLQYILEELVVSEISEIYIITSPEYINFHFYYTTLLDEIKMQFNINLNIKLHFIYQYGPYGNGTPLLCVKKFIRNESFLYMLSDDFFIATPNRTSQLLNVYYKYGCSAYASIRAKNEADYSSFGVAGGIEIENGVMAIDSIIEKPTKLNSPSNICIVSGFLFTSDIFNFIDQEVTTLGENQELSYMNAVRCMLKSGARMLAVEIKNGKYYDCGNKLSYFKTILDFTLADEKIGDQIKEIVNHIK